MKTEYQLWVRKVTQGWTMMDFYPTLGLAREAVERFTNNKANSPISDYRIVEVNTSTG